MLFLLKEEVKWKPILDSFIYGMCVKPVVLNHSLLFLVKGGSWQLNHVTCFKQFWQARNYLVDQSSWMYWNLFLAVTDESILLDSRWSGLYTWKENKATAARGREERTSVNTQQQADDNCRVCCGTWGFLETLLPVQTSYLCYTFAVELVWKTGLWKVSNPNPIFQYPGCTDFFSSFCYWSEKAITAVEVREIYQLCSLLLTFDWELGCLVLLFSCK